MGGIDSGRGVKRGGRDPDARRRKRQRYARSGVGEGRRDLPHGSRGFLISCDPRKENNCFREAHVLLADQIVTQVPLLASRFDVVAQPTTSKTDASSSGIEDNGESAKPSSPAPEPAAGVADALAAEVSALRNPKREDAVLSRIDLQVQGSVFIRTTEESVVSENIVEGVLRNAKKNQTPGSRCCVRFIPVYSTCYAKAEDAAVAGAKVALDWFPAGNTTYAIVFKSRMNSGARRTDFINEVAGAIEASAPGRFKVNLDKPDVVLMIEIIKTHCVIGCCTYFHELSKMNIREVSKPPEEDEAKKPADDKKSEPVTDIKNEVDTTRMPNVDDKFEPAEDTKDEAPNSTKKEATAVRAAKTEPEVDDIPKTSPEDKAVKSIRPVLREPVVPERSLDKTGAVVVEKKEPDPSVPGDRDAPSVGVSAGAAEGCTNDAENAAIVTAGDE